MTALLRRQFLTGLLATAGLSAGCGDLGSMVYFLMPEQKNPAEIKSIASTDKKKEVKALILVRNSQETSFEFRGADRELGHALQKQLADLCTYNEEHLTLIPSVKIDAFKSAHPSWQQLDPLVIGEHFKVDFVIDIDINELTLTTAQMVVRGKAEMSVRLLDVKHPEESSLPKSFTCAFPSDHDFIPADDETPLPVFRERFLNHAAQRLAWFFAPHPVRDSHYVE